VNWLAFLNPKALALAVMLAFVCFVMWRFQLDKANPYDFKDILLDPLTHKASLDKHVLSLMAMLAAWAVIGMVMAGKDIETLLLGVLGIFVLQRGVRETVTTLKGTDPPWDATKDLDRRDRDPKTP